MAWTQEGKSTTLRIPDPLWSRLCAIWNTKDYAHMRQGQFIVQLLPKRGLRFYMVSPVIIGSHYVRKYVTYCILWNTLFCVSAVISGIFLELMLSNILYRYG